MMSWFLASAPRSCAVSRPLKAAFTQQGKSAFKTLFTCIIRALNDAPEFADRAFTLLGVLQVRYCAERFSRLPPPASNPG